MTKSSLARAGYNKGMGRPTIYRKQCLKIAKNYLLECFTGHKIPFIQELSMRLEINDDTLNEWCKVNEDFSATIKRVKDYQKMRLMDDGLSGKVNTSMAIFLLKANHKLIETQRIQNTGDEEEPMTIIFTDPATWKRREENRKRLEESTSGIKDRTGSLVPLQKISEVPGGYDYWTDYVQNHH